MSAAALASLPMPRSRYGYASGEQRRGEQQAAEYERVMGRPPPPRLGGLAGRQFDYRPGKRDADVLLASQVRHLSAVPAMIQEVPRASDPLADVRKAAERADKARAASVRADAQLLAAVRSARAAGVTLDQVGAVLGVSRQRVHQMLRAAS